MESWQQVCLGVEKLKLDVDDKGEDEGIFRRGRKAEVEVCLEQSSSTLVARQ